MLPTNEARSELPPERRHSREGIPFRAGKVSLDDSSETIIDGVSLHDLFVVIGSNWRQSRADWRIHAEFNVDPADPPPFQPLPSVPG